MSDLKAAIIAQCKEVLLKRIDALEEELQFILTDIAEDNKSSAGDKYETSREMANLERQKLAEQLAQNKKSLGYLLNLNSHNGEKVAAGSLIETDEQVIFLAISFGLLEVADQQVMVVSPNAPLAQALLGKSPGDQVIFNNRQYKIKSVY